MRQLVVTFALILSSLVAAVPATAATISYTAILSGAAQPVPNASPATGTATVVFDDILNTMRVTASFSGLQGNATAAFIGGPTVTPRTGSALLVTPVPSFVGFPLGVRAGSFDQTFDMTLASSFRAGFITVNGGTPLTAFAALMTASAEGRAFFNIPSSAFPGGEIRGFLELTTATPVPLPASALLLLSGLGALGVAARRRRG